MTLTAEIVRELLDYEPLTGKFVWRIRGVHWFMDAECPHCLCQRWNRRFALKEAFTCKEKHGYPGGALLGIQVKAHRIAFLHYHGWLPKEIDHMNGRRDDNRIANLRAVTHAENMRNNNLQINNTSGCAGVDFNKANNVWRARIKSGGEIVWFKTFRKKEDAIKAIRAKRLEFGFSEDHGTRPPHKYYQQNA